jgi:Zn-dependent M28 family amino/carboxypeptidase
MTLRSRLRFSAVISLAVAMPASFPEQHGQATRFDPGIRPVTADSTRAEQISESAWLNHVKVLAGDDLKGRKTGSPEFIRAVEYVESQFKTIGLKPAGAEGYRQPVGFRSATVDSDHSTFSLVHGDATAQALKVGSEVMLTPNADEPVSLEAAAVFAGHGLVVPAVGVDDLKGLNLHGKIAVIFGGSSAAVHGPLKAYFRTTAIRWQSLKAAGAIGVITVPEPRPQLSNPNRGAGGPANGTRPIEQLSDFALNPLSGAELNAIVPVASAAALFAGSGHSLDELSTLTKDGGSLPTFPLAVSIRATTVTQVISTYEAPNVVGILPGSDPKLKNEYLVLTAHLDHLGVGRPVNGDAIYHGAMDNASGIASLIETAKALAAGPRPSRTIVFIAFTGEEEGELGSQFYARYPTVPRSHIVAVLNMDMYLPLFPLRFLEVQGLGESTLGNDARAAAQLNDIEVQFDKQPDENRFIRSDQASFVKYGIPALAFKFGWLPDSPEQKTFNDWIHDRYHRPSDDLNQPIDAEAAVHFDHVLLTLIRRVADSPGRPAWYPESFFSTIPRR